MTIGSRGHQRPFSVCLVFLLLLLCGGVNAQELPGRSLEPAAPPFETSALADSELEPATQDELGELVLLESRPPRRLFELTSSTQYLYTSNVSLVRDLGILEEESDSLLFQTFNLSFSPRLVEKLVSTVYLRHQIVRYDEHAELDFDTDAAGLSASYPVGEWFTAYAGWSARRMYARDTDNEFFKMYDTEFGLWRQHTISKVAKLFYGYQLDWRASSPSEFDRVDNAGYVGLNLTPNEKSTIQFLYRLRVQDYDEFFGTNRRDVDHLLALAFTYTFNQYVSTRIFANYADNNSNTTGRDYSVLDFGGGLNLSVKF